MVSSPTVMRKAFVGALLALLVGPPLPAQSPATDDVQPPDLRATGVGTLISGGTQVALPWVETARGPLVALGPLVERLGGALEAGPFGTGARLSVGDAIFVLAQGSAALTRGTEILPLSQPPLFLAGTAYVPLDLVPRVWGTLTGVEARWDAAGRRLLAERPAPRQIAVEISVVHLQGISTVVLRFAEPPRLRVERRPEGWEVIAVGDRFVPPAARRFDDPYLRAVSADAERILLHVAPEVDGEHYRLKGPERLVFDLYRAVGPAAASVLPPAGAAELPGLRTVVIDPGHGGAETGALGPAGTMEKELTLLISRTLAERLASELGVRVALTRTDDVDLGLDERSAFANQNKADLFLSVHLNSTARGDARGAETYFLSLQASDERAADAAALENLVGRAPAEPGSDEFDVQLMLWDLAQSRHLAASQRVASLIQEELNRELELPDRGVKQAPFRVLMGAAMPAVLVELGFLSSAPEEQRLREPAYRDALVATLVRAVGRFKQEYERAPGAGGAAR